MVNLRDASPELLQLVASRFSALGDPARIRILYALREGERTVSELIEETGFRQAKVSKHLQLLHRDRFVERRKQGLNVYYRIADPEVFRLCDLICGRLQLDAERMTHTVRLDGLNPD
ncbi:MAG: metalloregulator ArsR/SmtB family transcription factor [Nitrolancea sp.]